MDNASIALEDATAKIRQSVEKLNSQTREGGWQSLCEACKVIADKTTKLLKIVYGAELRRLFDTSERALESFALADAHAQIANEIPQVFAQSASEAATNAGTLLGFYWTSYHHTLIQVSNTSTKLQLRRCIGDLYHCVVIRCPIEYRLYCTYLS
jgi:hypothetical protein